MRQIFIYTIRAVITITALILWFSMAVPEASKYGMWLVILGTISMFAGSFFVSGLWDLTSILILNLRRQKLDEFRQEYDQLMQDADDLDAVEFDKRLKKIERKQP